MKCVLIMMAILVALFGERLWRLWDETKKRRMLRVVASQCLANFKDDLTRIRNVRNLSSIHEKTPDDSQHINFSPTSRIEIEHYYDIFIDLIIPNIATLRLPENSATIDFFDHYKKNLGKIKLENYLELGSVNCLLDRVKKALNELSV